MRDFASFVRFWPIHSNTLLLNLYGAWFRARFSTPFMDSCAFDVECPWTGTPFSSHLYLKTCSPCFSFRWYKYLAAAKFSRLNSCSREKNMACVELVWMYHNRSSAIFFAFFSLLITKRVVLKIWKKQRHEWYTFQNDTGDVEYVLHPQQKIARLLAIRKGLDLRKPIFKSINRFL